MREREGGSEREREGGREGRKEEYGEKELMMCIRM